MNGARTIFRRKGYLLTALTAAVLLAASSGTAWAQVTGIDIRSVAVDAADSNGFVPEGSVTSVTVILNKALPVGASVTVALALTADGAAALQAPASATTGTAEDNDLVLGAATVTILGGRDRASAQLIVNHDVDAVDEKFIVTARGLTLGDNPPEGTMIVAGTEKMTPGTSKIVDDEVQTYVLTTITPAAEITESNPAIMLSLRADPPRPAAEDETIFIRTDNPAYVVANDAGTNGLPVTDSTASVDVMVGLPGGNDKNRTDDTVTLTGFTGRVVSNKEVFSHSITVLDVHQLPAADAITAEAKDMKTEGTTVTSVEEGGTVYVWVTVANTDKDQVSDTEAFTVALSAANPGQTGDFRNSPNSFVVTGGRGLNNKKTVGPFKLEALEDQDVGMETLMLSLDVTGAPANGPGSSSGAFSIDIEDKTMKQVEPKTEAEAYPKIEDALEAGSGDEGFNPGESFSVPASDLFTVTDGYDGQLLGFGGQAMRLTASASERQRHRSRRLRLARPRSRSTGTSKMASVLVLA